jgi:hypothetical protein
VTGWRQKGRRGDAYLTLVTAATWLTLGLAIADRPALAFEPKGHEIIEAHAYLHVLSLKSVPTPLDPRGAATTGEDVLLYLVKHGILRQPDCVRPGCREMGAVEAYPPLKTGVADLVLARQSSPDGQCYHFMANSQDLDDVGGAPVTHASARDRAFSRCIARLTSLLDAVLANQNDPTDELTALYALMHAVADSYSRAHVVRLGEQFTGDIVALKPWRLLTWSSYFGNPNVRRLFWSDRYHYVADPRDEEYLDDGRYYVKPDASPTDEAIACSQFRNVNAYFVPDQCLSPLAQRAVDAVSALLVLVYTLHSASREKLDWPPSDEWRVFIDTYFGARLQVVPGDVPEPDSRRTASWALGLALTSDGERWGNGGLGFVGARAWLGNVPPMRPSEDLLFSYGHRLLDSHIVSTLGFSLKINVTIPVSDHLAFGVSPFFTSLTRFNPGGWAWDFGSVIGELAISTGPTTTVILGGPYWSWRRGALDNGQLASLGVIFSLPDDSPAAKIDVPASLTGFPTRPATFNNLEAELVLGSSICRALATPTGSRSRWSLRYGADGFWGHDGQGVPRTAYLGFGVYFVGVEATGNGTYFMPVGTFFGRWRPKDFLMLSVAPLVASGGVGSGDRWRGELGAEVSAALVIGGRLELRVRAPHFSYLDRSIYNGELLAIEFAGKIRS